jgi:hypothetical protein
MARFGSPIFDHHRLTLHIPWVRAIGDTVLADARNVEAVGAVNIIDS